MVEPIEDMVGKSQVVDCSYRTGRYAVNGECTYSSVVPCFHRSDGKNKVYFCEKWQSRGTMKKEYGK